MDWQPIKTAPKDGTDFLLHNSQFNEQFVCWWDDKRKLFRYGSEECCINLNLGETHWMPLPAPPTKGANS